MNLETTFCGVSFKNPVITASGTFGFGREYGKYYDLSELGGITVKGLTPLKRLGNPSPRVTETPAGMLNAVGLQNPGIEAFISDELPYLKKFGTRIIVNISAESAADFGIMAKKLSVAGVDLIEVNVSCPNVKHGGLQFGLREESVAEVTETVKKSAGSVPVIIKLSPNVTDIAAIAKAAESAGADGLSLINTLLGMRIDVKTHRPVLANTTGGLSGPAVLPVAVRCVYQVSSAVNIPIIGIGGISSGQDAVEMMLAGASLVAVGTANFTDPYAPINIRDGISAYLSESGFKSPHDITGKAVMK